MDACRPATVLITSSGSLVAAAILDSLDGRREDLRVIGVNSIQPALNDDRLDGVCAVPPVCSPTFPIVLAEVLTRESPDVVIPGRDDDVVALTALAGSGLIAADRLVAGPNELAVALRDTGEAALFAQAHGLPFAETVCTGLATSESDTAHLVTGSAGPWVIKPARGQGSQGVHVSWSPTEVKRWAADPGHVIQPYVGAAPDRPGDEATVDLAELGPRRDCDLQVVLGAEGQVLGMAVFESLMVGGKVTRVQALNDRAAHACAESYAHTLAALGWRGPVNIQAARADDGSVRPFEINPRFSGGTWLRRQAGFDEVGLTLRSFLRSGWPQG